MPPNVDMEKLWRIAVEGAADSCAGRPVDLNPYAPSEQALAWEAGWREARTQGHFRQEFARWQSRKVIVRAA